MYYITLTKDDIKTIAFVGSRYCWSDALLLALSSGSACLRASSLRIHEEEEEEEDCVLVLKEYEAWDLVVAFEEDAKGNHSLFPMLDPRSDLYEALITFMDRVI